MLFPEQLTNIGINAPKEHQRVISKLTTGLGALYYQQQKILLREADLEADQSFSPTLQLDLNGFL